MIQQDIYKQAKDLYLTEHKSLTEIGELLKISRKELSVLLKKDNVFTGKGYTQDQFGAAEILMANGFEFVEVCSLLKTDKSKFAKALSTKNIRQSNILSNTDYDYDSNNCLSIVQDYQNGIRRSELMEKYNINDGLLYRLLEFHNIPLDETHKRFFNFDEDFFSVIDSEEKAYWLGFLYADGYVYSHIGYTVELTLKKEDEEHIRKFQNTVKHNGELDDRHIELNQKHFLATRLSLCSKKMVEDLIKLGCFQNKSLELKFPTEKQVPNKLVHHFMRGYFDGDGCITTSRQGKDLAFSLLGTYEFLLIYEKTLNINIKEPKVTKSKAFIVQHHGNRQVKNIYEYLYKDATIYLERKRNVFFAVLGQNSQKTQDD